jgi:23S rRNA (pseudouridine1915-N3)-methyltransferase
MCSTLQGSVVCRRVERMKILIISVGKEKDTLSEDLIRHFEIRLLRYVPLEWHYLPHETTKEKEGDKILQVLKKEDYVVLLDEKGREMRSEAVAELLENRMVDSTKRIVFVIGGAYGVSDAVHVRANYTWRLSSLVFPHMLVRIILIEQLYRAMTILKGEKYHHE